MGRQRAQRAGGSAAGGGQAQRARGMAGAAQGPASRTPPPSSALRTGPTILRRQNQKSKNKAERGKRQNKKGNGGQARREAQADPALAQGAKGRCPRASSATEKATEAGACAYFEGQGAVLAEGQEEGNEWEDVHSFRGAGHGSHLEAKWARRRIAPPAKTLLQ